MTLPELERTLDGLLGCELLERQREARARASCGAPHRLGCDIEIAG
jgi:hypothetical protein